MKITHIGAQHYLRIVEADIAVRAPILLLAGENEQGKTSLADAIYHATTGIVRRVGLKKDFGRLVHDGEKRGSVVVALDGDSEDEARHYVVTIPNDKRLLEGVDEQPLLQELLDPRRFAEMKPEERRHLLFSITGKRITGKVIIEKLKEKGADPAKVATVGPVLLTGFAAGQTEAKAKASEARGGWKAVAGEVYGSKKADDWKAEKPAYDAERLAKLVTDIESERAKLAQHQQRQGEINALRSAAAKQQIRRIALVTLVDEIPRREAKLKTDEEVVAEWTAKVADTTAKAGEGPRPTPTPCPHCGGLVEVRGTPPTLHPHESGKAGDPQAIALLPGQRETLSRVIHARDNAKAHLEQAQNAKVQLQELDANPAAEVEPQELNDIQAQISARQQSVKALEGVKGDLEALRDRAARADKDTARAAALHKDVAEWEAIADWLAPSGIQSELLTEAMEPFNKRLGLTAQRTGWDVVTISQDMEILVGGRHFSLASASARWRALAAIAEAMSFVSGLKIFMLDEMELLIGANRLAFLKWMHQLAAAGEVETAIIIGSFKEAPKCPSTFQVEWVQQGLVGMTTKELAEVA